MKTITGFLIECDKNGSIANEYWCKPVYLISPYQRKAVDLFSEEEKPIIENMISSSINTEEVLACECSLKLRSPDIPVSVCFMSKGESVLVLGVDVESLDIGHALPAVKELVYNLMKLIKMSRSEIMVGSEGLIRSQFEQIQKLNNELLNMQRQVKKANAQLRRLNSELNNRLVKDALTGLVSRYQYREEIDLLIKSAPEKLGIFTFVDIDNFKSINDNYGHAAGDTYLREFARRLSGVSPENSIFMRISGDEFGIYTHGYEKVEEGEIESIWREIERNILSNPIDVDGNYLDVSCSAGMSVYGKDTVELYDLIEYADFAMYVAKKNGKNSYRHFTRELYKLKSSKRV